MCTCSSCKYTFGFKSFADWPRGEQKGKRASDAEYAAHWRHCGAEFGRKPACLSGSPFPCTGTPLSDPRIGYHFPGGQVARRRRDQKYPPSPVEGRPEYTEDQKAYAAAFCAANGLL